MPTCRFLLRHQHTSLFFSVLSLAVLLPCCSYAYDRLDPYGNITVKWDVMQWTGDGYGATVTLYNYQQYRHIEAPGWTLGWKWTGKEIIWSMVGGKATMQGDCSKFRAGVPLCCLRNPTIVDLLPGVPYNSHKSNCCRGGVLSSRGQDPSTAVASFQLTVGQAGNTNASVRLPENFTLQTPGPGYSCSDPAKTKPTLFIAPDDGRRRTQALMTWSLSCTYSRRKRNSATGP